MSKSNRWLSFFDSSSRLLLPPNNLRDSLTKLFFLQRGKARLLSSVAFTVLLAMFFSQTSSAQELIVNLGFESKLTGWQSNKSPIRTIAATNAVKTGTYAAHINNASQENEYFFQSLNASPFGKYSFSVWAAVNDASKWSTVGVNVYDAKRGRISSASFELEVNSTSFQKYSKDFTVPGNARYLEVYGYTEKTTLKVDDYSLMQAVGGTPTGTMTKNCKIENFRKCDGTNVGYGPWLNILINGAGGESNNEYDVNALIWQEYSDNTATIKGTITKKNDATVVFSVDLLLQGKITSGTGHFSAVDNNSFCVGQKGADWYFYPNASGTLKGVGSSVMGAQINVTLDPSMPWQVGTGGTTRFKDSFGSSAWVELAVVKQPTSPSKLLSIGKEGTDFYLDMPACTPPSVELCMSFTVSGANTNVTTNGGTNGAVNVTVAGGKSPLVYLWSNGATTEDLTGLKAGVYWLEVTDANKCIKKYQAVITQPNGTCSGFRTQTQGGWGSKANGENPGTYRDTNFTAAFPDGVTVGCGSKLLKLTTAKAIEDFLPSGSTASVLPEGTLTNPAGTYSNVLAGQVVALTLSIGFDNYDPTFGSSTTNLKDLFITAGTFSGKSVQFLLDEANKALGGCSTTYSLSDINSTVSSVNESYVDGTSTGSFLACCNNVISGGIIGSNQSGCSGYDPATFTSVTDPSGGSGALEIIWLKSTTSSVFTTTTASQWTTISGATGLTYDSESLTQTTYFIRCSRRAGCTDYVGESNVITITINANCGGKDLVCLSRKSAVQNSSLCGDATKSYGMWFNDLKGNVASVSQHFSVKSGELTEFCDGTAVLTYTACVTGGGANDCITATVNYSGRTGTPPASSPVLNTHCATYTPNVNDWYYYPSASGSLSGVGIYAGLAGTYTQNMGAFQVGTGGSLNDISKFGASSWFKINITNGGINNWSTVSKEGDVNINLGTSTNIASVTATANPTSICQGENVVLTATIDAVSKSANCLPTYSWVGSNGFTSTQATITDNNVQGATTYTVTVTFIAVNGSKCSVTATTVVALSAICCDNVTNGGQITGDQRNCGAFDPVPFTNVQLPSGGTGTVEYIWLRSTTTTTFTAENADQWIPIVGSTGATLDLNNVSVTTAYQRCSRRAGCTDYDGETNVIIIIIDKIPVAPTTTPAAICGTGTVTLGANCATGTVMWYTASTDVSSIATGASFITPSLTVTTSYYVSCKSAEGCESVRMEVKATVIGKITDGGTIKADETICVGGTPSKITGVTPASGGDVTRAIEYIWLQTSSLTNGSCPLNIVGQNLYTEIPNTNTADYQPGSITQTTCYIRCARRNGCTDYISGESNTVKKTVEAIPKAPAVTPATICGTGTVTLGATCSMGTAMWYAGAAGGSSIATGASFTTPSLTMTTTYYVSCKTDAGCESGRTPVMATVNPNATAPTVMPAVICGTGTVTLGANCATGTAMWYAGAAGGSSITTGASFTTPSLTTTTIYYVSCKTTEGCESLRMEVKATIIGKITDGGTIKADETICAGTIPSKIVNVTLPTGGDASLAIEYIWLQTTSLTLTGACPTNNVSLYMSILGATSVEYQPGAITQATCYIRCARRAGCTNYEGESNIVKKIVTSPFTISAVTNPNAVCSGTTVNITVKTMATGTISYVWAGPNTFTANTKDVSIPNATLAANGIYTVFASNGGGCTAVATVHVKVVNCLKIGDLVFNDKNNNGKQGAGELGTAGVTVKLFDSANNQVGSSTTTDANGNYLFSNLPSGNYVVEIVAPMDYKSSTGTNGSLTGIYEPAMGATNVNNEDNGTTVSGQTIRSKPIALTTTDNTNVDFGLFRPAKLGDTVFRDLNGDGKQNAGEGGVAGVTVKLYDSANNVIATKTTDVSGKYLFDNLTAGNYTVEFVKSTLQSGFNFSPQGTTTGDKDSDANVTTGTTGIITLIEGQTNNDIDAGVTTPCDTDITPPVLSACPYDVLIKTRGTVAKVSWTAPTATDNCGTPVVISTNAIGSLFPIGSTTVIYTARDAKGNKTTCSFKVTVVKIIACETDTQAPVFYDCPTDITLNITGTGAVALWDHPSVGDNCGIPSVIFNYSPGQTFPVGVTTVIYTAKDAKGNTSYCMFKVTVIKKTALSTPVTESMNATTSTTPITASSSRVAVIEEVKVGDEVTVYPNPSSSDILIELSAELMKVNSSVEVSVFNMTGTTQFTQTAKGTERISVKVPVQDMPNGTYFVNVGLDNGRMIIKKLQIFK